MTPPFLLIAEREFRAYAATLSFWIALAVGPLALAGAVAVAALAQAPARPQTFVVEAPDPALARDAAAAVMEAARLEGRSLTPASASDAAPAMRLTIEAHAAGSTVARFDGPRPLSAVGRALVARTLELDTTKAAAGGLAAPMVVAVAAPRPVSKGPDAGALARFGLVMMLWLTLTGSLGMLLQAVVRERSNRALESLLAAARPWEVALGKLTGVGAVSLLVLVAWLGSAAALAPLAPGGAGVAATVLKALGDPLQLARAGAIYALAFTFYGLITIAVGAAARDTAAAQNLSRPMFAVLLAAFFVALAAAGGAAAALGWLVYVPPFTPFMLLLAPPGSLSAAAQVAGLGLMVAGCVAAGAFAVRTLTVGAPPAWGMMSRRTAA